MQEFIVGLVVACAACNVLWRYTPAGVRRKLRGVIVQLLRQVGQDRMEKRFAKDERSGACGGCSGCSTQHPEQAKFSISVDALRRTAKR